jgi:hypothetical protein
MSTGPIVLVIDECQEYLGYGTKGVQLPEGFRSILTRGRAAALVSCGGGRAGRWAICPPTGGPRAGQGAEPTGPAGTADAGH